MKTPNLVRFLLLACFATGSSLLAQNSPRQQALAAAAAGQWEAAEPQLERLAQAEPADVDACLQLSARRLQQNRAKDAVELMTRAAEAAPDRSDVQAALGNALSRRIGEVAFVHQAILASRMHAAYQKAVQLDPNNIGGWIGLTQYSLNAPAIAGGSLEKAEEYAKEVEKRDAGLGALQRGQVSERSGRLGEAMAHFRRATELQPGNPWAWTCLGRAAAASGDSAEARRAYETALARAPHFGPAEEGIKALEAKPASAR